MYNIALLFMDTILSATIWEEFNILFAEMGIPAAICLAVGIVFIIIEIFSPGFGFFGISGVILLIVGIILRVAQGGSGNPLAQLLMLILITSIILIVAFIIMSKSAKKGWLSRTPIIMSDAAVPTGITGGTNDYSLLIGKEGVAVTTLRPSGIATIDGERRDVVAEGSYIANGSPIIVSKIEGVRIVVREKDSKEL
ncbi:MAG: NfeD family protein [Clostridia bacterium]